MFSKMKDMLFEADTNAPQPAPQAKPATTSTVPGQVNAPAFVPQDNQFVDAIRKQVFSRTTAFTALQTAADSLKDIIPDPVTRLKAAHKTGGLGRSPKEFSDAIMIHLSDIDGEERRFTAALEQSINASVGVLKSQADSAASTAAAMSKQIQTLQEQIAAMHTQITEQTALSQRLAAEAAEKEAGLRQNEHQFKAAAQIVRDELNVQKAAISSTLG